MIENMISYLWTFVGVTPYKLGGNVIQDGGLDCSALALEGLRSIGKWGKSDARAQDIFNSHAHLGILLKPTDTKAQKGDLLFWGESTSAITHISIGLNSYQMIEAGGDDKTGMVRVRPFAWRKDLVAIVRLSP